MEAGAVRLSSNVYSTPKRMHSIDLTQMICEGLKEVKAVRDGKKPRKSADELLNEL